MMPIVTEVFINNNVPPHGILISQGMGNYSAQQNTMAVTNFGIPGELPVKGERYFVASNVQAQYRFDGTVTEVNRQMVFLADLVVRA